MSQTDATQWLHVFQEQINGVSFNTEQGPLWRVALLREASSVAEQENLSKNALLFTFHHLISDVLSVLALQNKLVEFLGSLHNGEAIETKTLPFRVPIESTMTHLTSPHIWERLIIASNLTLHKLRALFNLKNIYMRPYNMEIFT